jgi:pilus assembly protein Flp/PilA
MNLNFTKKKSDLVNRFSSERGITAIEYALLAALIAVAIIGGATLLGTTLDGFFSAVADKIDTYKP